jgi:hypothetical protein
LEQLPLAAVEHFLGQGVAAFLEVAHCFDAPAVGFTVDDRQDVQGLEEGLLRR